MKEQVVKGDVTDFCSIDFHFVDLYWKCDCQIVHFEIRNSFYFTWYAFDTQVIIIMQL